LADIAPGAFGANVPSTIWTVARDGARPSPDHVVRGPRRRPTPPRPGSPDGQHIAFATYSEDPRRLWSVPAAGGPATLLDEAHGAIFDPVYAPDGRSVYYATGGPFIIRVPVAAGRRNGPHDAIATAGPRRRAPPLDQRRRPPSGHDEPDPLQQPLDGGRVPR
jgi:dipeptidyl aminopeptidase/acylaminoacyl peptidase